MKAISLWQPWASLWLTDRKMHETRHWRTSCRGPLVVHAAKKIVSECGEDLDELVIQQFGPYWRTKLPRGALIGVVEVVACKPTESFVPGIDDYHCGDFSEGRFAWERTHVQRLAAPIPFKGRQGLFDVPDVLIELASYA